MKRLDWIVAGVLGLLIALPATIPSALAQDDGYLTPSRSRQLKAKAKEEEKALMKERAKRLAEQRAEQVALPALS